MEDEWGRVGQLDLSGDFFWSLLTLFSWLLLMFGSGRISGGLSTLPCAKVKISQSQIVRLELGI